MAVINTDDVTRYTVSELMSVTLTHSGFTGFKQQWISSLSVSRLKFAVICSNIRRTLNFNRLDLKLFLPHTTTDNDILCIYDYGGIWYIMIMNKYLHDIHPPPIRVA